MINRKSSYDLHRALRRIEYLNLIVVSAAAAPERLPYLQAHPEIDPRVFQQQMGSLVCLLQTHLADLANVLRGVDTTDGRFADFRPLVADTCAKIQGGAGPRETLHRHLRNVFAFDDLVHSDQCGSYGAYIRNEPNEYGLAVAWLLETLSCIECGFRLHEILGDAQNTDVCTRLCFGDAVNALETWRRDLQLILPGTASIM
ncbi:MAG: hypothetical protein ACXW4B_06450 [Micavibrio sp.]